MPVVTLYNTKRPTRGDPKRRAWLLRWVGTDGKRHCDTVGVVGKMTKREAEALQREKQGKMDNGLTPIDRPRKMTLGEFIDHDREAIEADTKPATLLEYDHATNHMKEALGSELQLHRVGRAEVAYGRGPIDPDIGGEVAGQDADQELRSGLLSRIFLGPNTTIDRVADVGDRLGFLDSFVGGGAGEAGDKKAGRRGSAGETGESVAVQLAFTTGRDRTPLGRSSGTVMLHSRISS